MLAIEEACVEPQIAKDLLPVLFARKLDSRQMMMALGEAIAHIHLLRTGTDCNAQKGKMAYPAIDPLIHRCLVEHTPDDHEAPDDHPAYV